EGNTRDRAVSVSRRAQRTQRELSEHHRIQTGRLRPRVFDRSAAYVSRRREVHVLKSRVCVVPSEGPQGPSLFESEISNFKFQMSNEKCKTWRSILFSFSI